jgi:glyoxylase-like metal-dependent hydrolase (beta-lactamase superfamily II)
MKFALEVITLALPMRLGSVNCYLTKTEDGFILFDTGGSNQRAELDRRLSAAGCAPGNLKLILLTHGDFDHSGNAAHLRHKFAAPVAMHPDDAGMVERGDMSWNRHGSKLVLRITSGLFGFGEAERFTPDVLLSDGDVLTEYGLNATVLRLPGHSSGSIGVLLPGGIFICGDLLSNTKRPAINDIMDDREAARATVEMLTTHAIAEFYPGHGQPFSMASFLSAQQ